MVVKNDYDSYFYNNLYDDVLVSDAMDDFQHRLYSTILKGKEWLQNNDIYSGPLYDLSIDQDINMKYGMPMYAYSLRLRRNILPFYSEKKFFDQHGYGTPISSLEIMKDNAIFSRSLYFFLNNHLICDVQIVILRSGCIVFIVPSSEDAVTTDLHRSDLEKIISDDSVESSWTIMLTTKADFYMTTKQRLSLFDGNKIYLSNFSTYKAYRKPRKKNAWTMYLTGTASSYNIMNATSVGIFEDDKGEYFLVPENFKNAIYQKASIIRCLVVNEPECEGSGIFIQADGANPIFQIPFKKNPIPKKNLRAWAYDFTTQRKLHPLEIDADLYYPNIYDFGRLMSTAYYQVLYTKSRELVITPEGQTIVFGRERNTEKRFDLWLEWIEPMGDCSAYDSYIQDFIDFYGDEYATMMVHGKLPAYIRDYHPIVDPKFGAFDYFHSEFKGDYRAWKLDCLIKLLKDNPKRYDEFFRKIYYRNKRYVTRSYTYENEPHIYTRSVMSTEFLCGKDNIDYYLEFQKPQAYLAFYDWVDAEKPVLLTIDGVHQSTSFVMKWGTSLFVFFDADLLENKKPIRIDIETSSEVVESGKLYFSSMSSGYDMEKLNFRKNSLDNLIFYVDNTGEYLCGEDLNFNAQIAISDIQYIGEDKVDTVSEIPGAEVLYTEDQKLVVPTGHSYIVFKITRINHEITDPRASQVVDLDNVEISLKPDREDLVRKSIGVSTGDFFQKRIDKIEFLPTVEDTDGKSCAVYTYKNYKGIPSGSRIRVYIDGRRISPKLYTLSFAGYDKDMQVVFDYTIARGDLLIEHAPFDEELIYDGSIYDLRSTEDEIWYLGKILDTPFDDMVYKIYVNGKRVSTEQIRPVGQSNMLIINNQEVVNGEDMHVMIYQQKMDEDVYDYDSSSQFMDAVSINDSAFRQYLIQKYK